MNTKYDYRVPLGIRHAGNVMNLRLMCQGKLRLIALQIASVPATMI